MAAATGEPVEPLFITPEALGVGAWQDQRLQSAPLQHPNEGSSTGEGPADREVPAGPRSSSPHHVTQDGAAEASAAPGITSGGPGKSGAKKRTKKGGAKEAAAKTAGAGKKDRRGRTKGPARSPGSRSPAKRPRNLVALPAHGEGDATHSGQNQSAGSGPPGRLEKDTAPPRDRQNSICSTQDETASTITSLTHNDKEEGEWSGDETEIKPTSSRLFQAEHFQRLLTKVISTLNYQMETPEEPRSSTSAKLDPRGFKKPVKVQTFSPFPDYFEDVIQKEWANPGGGTSLLSVAKRLYSLPDRIMEDLKVPLIDAPVVALHSGAILSKDGENALRDAFDKKNEAALKKAHEAMSLAIRAAAALSNFTRATAIWADNLLQNPEVSPLVLKRTLLKMKRAAEFAADASQDNIQFCARAQAANITIRRNIWLKHWKVDALSKSNLATEKFSGRLLFGESNLEKVLVETREKKKAMPSSSYRREGEGKTRPSHSFRAPYNAGRGRDTRDRPFKSFKFGMRNSNKNTPNYRPGKGPNPKKQVA
ncbi:UNVERIFIED_CONTAM: hypothetical protein K2H54_054170 [Gekko kuhli]